MYEQVARNYRALYKEKYGRDPVITDDVIIAIWQEHRAFDDQDTVVLDVMHEHWQHETNSDVKN